MIIDVCRPHGDAGTTTPTAQCQMLDHARPLLGLRPSPPDKRARSARTGIGALCQRETYMG